MWFFCSEHAYTDRYRKSLSFGGRRDPSLSCILEVASMAGVDFRHDSDSRDAQYWERGDATGCASHD
jgi:hypothetical protein